MLPFNNPFNQKTKGFGFSLTEPDRTVKRIYPILTAQQLVGLRGKKK